MLDMSHLEIWLKEHSIKERARERCWKLIIVRINEFRGRSGSSIDDFDAGNVIAPITEIKLEASPWPAPNSYNIHVYIDISYLVNFYRRKDGEKIFYLDNRKEEIRFGLCKIDFSAQGDIESEHLEIYDNIYDY